MSQQATEQAVNPLKEHVKKMRSKLAMLQFRVSMLAKDVNELREQVQLLQKINGEESQALTSSRIKRAPVGD